MVCRVSLEAWRRRCEVSRCFCANCLAMRHVGRARAVVGLGVGRPWCGHQHKQSAHVCAISGKCTLYQTSSTAEAQEHAVDMV